MDKKVPELLDLTRKLLDQSMEIVNNSLPSSKSGPVEEVRYSIFLRVQMSEALKFGYGAYHSCNCGWGHGAIGAARSIYEILLDIKYINHDETHYDGTIRLWNPAIGEHIETIYGHESTIRSIVFGPDVLTLASGSADGTIKFWDADTGRHKRNFSKDTDEVHSVVFSPDGSILASGSEDGTIRLWKLSTIAGR